MFKKFLKSKLQRGQALVFLAITAPILMLFLGAAADFGWLYLYQSRLQNAADAAVIAGAKRLVSTPDSDTNEYTYSRLVSNRDENFLRLVNQKIISTKDTSFGDKVAQQYAALNLAGFFNDKNDLRVVDVQANKNVQDDWNVVKFRHILYGSDPEDDMAMYYAVILSRKNEHMFSIMNYFDVDQLNSQAMAVAKITYHIDSGISTEDDPVNLGGDSIKHGISLYQQMKLLRANKTYADWWKIKESYDHMTAEAKLDGDIKDLILAKYKTLDAMNIARTRSVQAKGNEYVEGNFYRTETLTLHGWSIASTGNGNTTGSALDQRNLDSLFVDLKVDRKGGFKDTDPGSTQGIYNLDVNNKQITDEQILKYRIHDLINIGKWNGGSYEYVYKVRSGKEPPDPLYVYIESEDNYVDGGSGNTVRQMIINVNADNTDEYDRPMFLFYDGPQKYGTSGKKQRDNVWNEKWRETWKHLISGDEYDDFDSDYIGNSRNSLPVILNINANFKGVLFAPNSPVVINGNEKNFTGFVVAQKFLSLKTAKDFPEVANFNSSLQYYRYLYRDSKFNNDNDEINTYKCFFYTDDRGNQYYKNKDNIVFYHKKAEGGTRYIQVVTEKNGNKIEKKYRNVIYATGSFPPAAKNPEAYDGTLITTADNVYENTLGGYVTINPSDPNILYTYAFVEEEKSNIIKTFASSEKPYVKINPMYVDEFGNVQYMPLTGDIEYEERPTPVDTAWHKGDRYEIIYKPETFNLDKVRYDSFYQVELVNYTKLNNVNEKGESLNDVFYTTIRSDWID